MGKFTITGASLRVGQIVLVEFPHSDLKTSKKRPALVVAKAEFDNIVLCQITSRSYTSKIALKIELANFLDGGLPRASYIRPDKLFTADIDLIEGVRGELNTKTLKAVLQKIRKLFI